jgi:uncharacterized protein (TIGR02118 family)
MEGCRMARTYKVSVMYPNQDGAKFDFDYYRSTHMKLVETSLKPFGLLRTSVEKGISGGAGQKAPYVCVGHLIFDRPDGYDEGAKKAGPELRADIANFTNVAPTRQISEVLD